MKHLSASERKQKGAHYTPRELARFLAQNIITYVPNEPLRILDPACGDGELLEAFAECLPENLRDNCVLVGFDTHEEALVQARRRLAQTNVKEVQLKNCDFLSWSRAFRDPRFFEEESSAEGFDVVISNPPYVRTQVLGGKKSRSLATQFGITGRVDLYHAFASGMTEVLKPGGVLGLLCSNRFLSIQAGASLRKTLLQSYSLHQIFDLGDTKLFDAAVLPAIVIGTRRDCTAEPSGHCEFTKVYECPGYDEDEKFLDYSSPLEAVKSASSGRVRVGKTIFEIQRGTLADVSDFSDPWRLSSPEHEEWLGILKRSAPYRFADFVDIRVGIKTTADNVFIRDDWERLSPEMQPEPELLRNVLSVDIADQYWKLPPIGDKRMLYTHTVLEGKRVPIDLDSYPRATQYLEHHKKQLQSRKYVIEAGRRWYEIWVPQQPSDWDRPKVVFPDISEKPKFFFDGGGSVVDGNCYWFTSNSIDHLYLLLAVANSPSIVRFYDVVCGNRLYSGRRRFITQYVEKFPVPDPEGSVARELIALTKDLYGLEPFSEMAERRITGLNHLVSTAFTSIEELVT